MQFEITITVDIDHESGKFVSADDMQQLIAEGAESAVDEIVSGIDGCGDTGESVYVLADSNVDVEHVTRRRSSKASV